jgi:hypothetical protein
LEEIDTEEAGHAEEEHAAAEIVESFAGFLGTLEETEDMEEVVGLNGRRGTMKR